MSTIFKQLNPDWNAEPNSPSLRITVGTDDDLVLAFYMNAFQFPDFKEEDVAYLRFEKCRRYRLGKVNDEGWYRGQCRFSKLAPAWGEFYEVSGDLLLNRCPNDWVAVGPQTAAQKHYLFYFRDEEFEADAESWTLEVHNLRNEIKVR
jgi:hypothetical protein